MNIKDNALFTLLRFGAYKSKKQPNGDTYTLSRPVKMNVHGIVVDKAPVGRYIDFTKRMPNIVMEVLDATFPGMKPDDVLRLLSTASDDPNVIRELITRLISVAPEKLIEVLADIVGTQKDKLLALSPAELMDVVEAFWKINDYTDFFQRARRAAETMRNRQNTQSSDGSPARPVSE